MGRKKLTEKLCVYSNTQFIGTLTKASTGTITFKYDLDWVKSPESSPISRSLPLTSELYRGHSVANYFDNLLPDNDSIRKILAQKSKSKSDRPFDLLSIIGRDCIGSLLLLPEGEILDPQIYTIKSRPISDLEIANTLKNLGRAPLGVNIDEDFRISIAGAQEKTAFLKMGDHWRRPHGTTPTTHMFKIPMGIVQSGINMTSSVENEWLCLEICRAFGLPVSNTEIKTFAGEKALVVERFDREIRGESILRLHQEDFCQALGFSSSLKYQKDGGPGIHEIAEVLWESSTPQVDRRNFMMSQILFWLIGATDGHAKNFSVFLTQDGIKLTPLYDVMSAFPAIVKGPLQYERLKLAMRITSGRYHLESIARRHFIEMAKEVKFPVLEMDQIIDGIIEKTHEVINQVAKILPRDFPLEVSEPIFNGMKMHVNRLKN